MGRKRVLPFMCCWNCAHGLLNVCETPLETDLLNVSWRTCELKASRKTAEKDPLSKRQCSNFLLNTGNIMYRPEGVSEREATLLRGLKPEVRLALLKQRTQQNLSKPVSQFTFPLPLNKEGRFVLGLLWLSVIRGDQEAGGMDRIETIAPICCEKTGETSALESSQAITAFSLSFEKDFTGEDPDAATVFAILPGKLEQREMGRGTRPVECYLTVSNEDVQQANTAYEKALKSGMIRKSGLPVLSAKEMEELSTWDIFRSNQEVQAWKTEPTFKVFDLRTGQWAEDTIDQRLWRIVHISPSMRTGLTYFGRVKKQVSREATA